MKNLQEFKGREVLGMQLLSDDNKYSETSKLKGEKYSNYAIKGFVISINEKLRFHDDFNKNNVFSITVEETQIPTDDGSKTVWSYVEYTTVKGEVVMAKAERQINDARGLVSAEQLATVDIREIKED